METCASGSKTLTLAGTRFSSSFRVTRSCSSLFLERAPRYNNKLFDPGEYELRILYDENQNGVWDPGNFFEHRQPEKVQPIRRKAQCKGELGQRSGYYFVILPDAIFFGSVGNGG